MVAPQLRRGGRGRAGLLVMLVVVLALGASAVPAAAKPVGGGGGAKPPPSGGSSTTSANIDFTADSPWNMTTIGCEYTATYRWSGFKGKLNYAARLMDRSGATLASSPQVQNVAGNGEFVFFFVFSGTPGGPARDIYVHGSLLSGGAEVSGSAVDSVVLRTTCTGSVSVRWLQEFILT